MVHFFDIGANIGSTFDWYLFKTTDYDNCHIWCFEPSPRHIDHLRVKCKSIMDHNYHSFKITVCAFGLSNFTGCAKLFETTDMLGDSLLPTRYERPVELMCGVMDAAQFIKENFSVEDRIVLKIDAEGSEVQIVDSILNSPWATNRIEKLMIEFHQDTENEMKSMLGKLDSAGIKWESWLL